MQVKHHQRYLIWTSCFDTAEVKDTLNYKSPQMLLLTLKMTSSQHTSRALDAQRGCTQPATQQERIVIDQIDLETDKADVEPVLG